MPVTTTPVFAQSIAVGEAQILPFDYTILKTLFTAGVNGSLIDFISASSSDANTRDLQFYITSVLDIEASGTLTSTGTNVSNNDTVTIGGKVYTFQSSLTNADGNVKIGTTAALSLTNLINAINCRDGIIGTDYATAMTPHPSVVAANGASSNTMLLEAKTAGVSGNSITTTESASTLSFASATLTGGVTGAECNCLLATVSINGNAGFSTNTSLISILDHARLGSSSTPTGLQILDPNGNKLLRLAAGEKLKVKSMSNVTAGKVVYIRASGVHL